MRWRRARSVRRDKSAPLRVGASTAGCSPRSHQDAEPSPSTAWYLEWLLLNIHLHCLVLDGVYRTTEGVPVFHAVRAPTAAELQALLTRIIKRLMRLSTRKGLLRFARNDDNLEYPRTIPSLLF
jgi:hypothetical protein